MNKQEIQDKIEALQAELKPLQEKLREIDTQEANSCEAKVKACYAMKDKFTPDELRYSREAKCECGAGLAYPKATGLQEGAWHCSAILTGVADKKVLHTGRLPFSMYEVKSENDNQTTRP